MVTGHEMESLRRSRIAEIVRPLRTRWLSGSEMFIGVAWAAVIVVASIGGMIDILHG
jgi:hypothetical protein